MNLQKLNNSVKSGEFFIHHTAMTRGYVSRKINETEPCIYKGKFGEGFTTLSPSFDTTRYCFITYYINNYA